MLVTLWKGGEEARVQISRSHTNIVLIEKDGEALYREKCADKVLRAAEDADNDGGQGAVGCKPEVGAKGGNREDADRALLNMEAIYDFAETVDPDDVREVIDVMNEAAKLAGYTVKWEDVDFDGIVPSVKQGKADIGIAGITYTEERAKQVDFSDVYYAGEDAQNYVLTMKSSGMKKTEDIKGKKWTSTNTPR